MSLFFDFLEKPAGDRRQDRHGVAILDRGLQAAEEAVVIYHSHTATEAYPSRTDISYANEPQAHYVLVSTREELAAPEFRSYRITDGVVTEEPVEVTGSPE